MNEFNQGIKEKYKQMDKFQVEKDRDHKKSLMMKQELHNLKVMDTHRNQERLKWQSD